MTLKEAAALVNNGHPNYFIRRDISCLETGRKIRTEYYETQADADATMIDDDHFFEQSSAPIGLAFL